VNVSYALDVTGNSSVWVVVTLSTNTPLSRNFAAQGYWLCGFSYSQPLPNPWPANCTTPGTNTAQTLNFPIDLVVRNSACQSCVSGVSFSTGCTNCSPGVCTPCSSCATTKVPCNVTNDATCASTPAPGAGPAPGSVAPAPGSAAPAPGSAAPAPGGAAPAPGSAPPAPGSAPPAPGSAPPAPSNGQSRLGSFLVQVFLLSVVISLLQ